MSLFAIESLYDPYIMIELRRDGESEDAAYAADLTYGLSSLV